MFRLTASIDISICEGTCIDSTNRVAKGLIYKCSQVYHNEKNCKKQTYNNHYHIVLILISFILLSHLFQETFTVKNS